MSETSTTDARILSHLAIRQLVGLLGFGVPTALYIYALADRSVRMQPSISEFYYTPMGDILVGGLVAIGVFLLSYRGYADKPAHLPFGDRTVAVAAGIGAIGTALIPTGGQATRALCYGTDPLGPCPDSAIETGAVTGLGILPDGLQNALHFGSAGLFLISLAYFCLFLFPIGPRKTQSRSLSLKLYRVCGWIILSAIVALAVLKLIFPGLSDRLDQTEHLTFWLEALAVFAFSAAWLVKGKPLKHPMGLNAPRPRA